VWRGEGGRTTSVEGGGWGEQRVWRGEGGGRMRDEREGKLT
jgi:hypothetical protein